MRAGEPNREDYDARCGPDRNRPPSRPAFTREVDESLFPEPHPRSGALRRLTKTRPEGHAHGPLRRQGRKGRVCRSKLLPRAFPGRPAVLFPACRESKLAHARTAIHSRATSPDGGQGHSEA